MLPEYSPASLQLDSSPRDETVQISELVSAVALSLIGEGALPAVLQDICQAIVDILDVAFARVWVLNNESQELQLLASAGLYTHLNGVHGRVAVGKFKIGLIAEEGVPHLTNDVQNDARVNDKEWAAREGMVAFAGYPLIVEGRVVGVVALFARRKLTTATLGALGSIAKGIALGIDRKTNEERLRSQTEFLHAMNRVANLLAGELDLKKVVQVVTDLATELTRAQFGAFFYNLIDDEGASYTLFTISGVPEEHFTSFPMPRATGLFGPTFRGEGTIRLGNVREDERFGKNDPYFGMPRGHLPVTSYLAVPVVAKSGEVIGGLFFGHEQADVFRENDERIVESLAAQASVAMHNASLFEAAARDSRKAEHTASDNQRLYDEAQLANRMKDDFLATISHELRTPLTAMLGWTNMLLSGDLSADETQRALQSIDRNARAQAQIIEDVLDISRIISGKLRLDVRLIKPAEVIEAAVESMRPAAQAKQIRLQLLLDPLAGPVSGDPERLQQVIWNLVSNAVKFTPRGGRVQVRLERVNSHVEIVVTDTGCGIAPEFLAHVFDRFMQVDSSTTRQQGGLGIGLAIVRQIVELHGGSVTAESRGRDQGAVFTVALPLTVVPDSYGVAGNDRVHPSSRDESVNFQRGDQLKGTKILVVDDEEDTRHLLKFVLQSCGAEVLDVPNADQALQAIQCWAPDILLSDIGMPETDGYELISQIRERETAANLPRLPAVALTAYARVEDRVRVLSAGFQMHVSKPVEPAELVAIVASLKPST